jgi:hypothetical protein
MALRATNADRRPRELPLNQPEADSPLAAAQENRSSREALSSDDPVHFDHPLNVNPTNAIAARSSAAKNLLDDKYLTWSVTLAVCIPLVIYMDWNEPAFLLARQNSLSANLIGRLLGNLIADIGGAVLLSGLLFGWRASDRKYWPLGTLVLMGLTWLGARSEQRMANEERSLQVSAVESRAASILGRPMPGTHLPGNPFATAPADSLPVDYVARLLWVDQTSLADFSDSSRALATRIGVNIDRLPDGWGSARYFANASSRPDIGKYWSDYDRYLSEIQLRYPTLMREIVDRRLDIAGVEGSEREEYRQAFIAGSQKNEKDVFKAVGDLVRAAIRLHAFLVSTDDRISYDAASDLARFDRQAELRRFNQLTDDLKAAGSAYGILQQREKREQSLKLDSLRRITNASR